MKIQVSKEIKQFAKAIDQVGGRTFVVGGAVRDTMAKRPFVDIDIMVSGITVKSMVAIARRISGQSVDQVISHSPVFMVIFDGEPVEVAMARIEKSTGKGKSSFEFISTPDVTPAQDMARREATMNAMAWNIMTGQVFDPFDGRSSIESGVIHAVSAAFVESPERGFRVAAQAARFGMTVSAQTIAFIKEAGVQGFGEIAFHQRWMHFEKMAGKAVVPSRWVEVMEEAEWFAMFMPMVKVTQEMKDAMDKVPSMKVHVPAEVTDVDAVKKIVVTEKASWMVAAMIKGMSDSDRKEFFKVMGFKKSVVRRAKEVAEFGGDRPQAVVTGKHFMAAGMKGGKAMGDAVKAAFKAQVAGQVVTEEDGAKFVADWMAK